MYLNAFSNNGGTGRSWYVCKLSLIYNVEKIVCVCMCLHTTHTYVHILKHTIKNIFCNIVRLYIYQLVTLQNARSNGAVFADTQIGLKLHRVWHHRISSSIVWRRKNLPHQCLFQRFEKMAATNSNLIFNYVINDININIFDIYCFEVCLLSFLRSYPKDVFFYHSTY